MCSNGQSGASLVPRQDRSAVAAAFHSGSDITAVFAIIDHRSRPWRYYGQSVVESALGSTRGPVTRRMQRPDTRSSVSETPLFRMLNTDAMALLRRVREAMGYHSYLHIKHCPWQTGRVNSNFYNASPQT